APGPRRTIPAQREERVEPAAPPLGCTIAHRREVGDETEVEEEKGDGEVRENSDHVPSERASKLRPDLHRRWVREEPAEEPRPTEVEERKEGGLKQREDRHHLGEAVDRRSPTLFEEKEKRGDERSGVTDPDPPHEIRDPERPPDGDVVAPDADAGEHGVGGGD